MLKYKNKMFDIAFDFNICVSNSRIGVYVRYRKVQKIKPKCIF